MKKYFALAMVALLMTAGAAMAAPRGMEFITPNATFATGSPSTTNNDDSCDISNQPAATLLLPVFEVDINAPATTAVNTVFTITNTSNIPQIAHITLWTDWSFPVLDFNVFLTGYDVQGISLYDVIVRGVLPGGGNQVGRGSLSANNTTGNVNFAPGAASACANLPTQIPDSLQNDIRTALTTGRTSGCSGFVGSANTLATGYVTIDTGNTCSQSLPTDPLYYVNEILFDNTLIGDYQRINPTSTVGNYAGGESLVPIRAIPEGGPAGFVPTNLPYTFYDRYTPDGLRTADRRQPLPSLFAARFIEGGTGEFNTEFAIWREGVTRGTAGCAVSPNGALGIEEFIRFDERENPSTTAGPPAISPAPPNVASLPEASFTASTDSVFPPDVTTTSDTGGWMYMNLDNGGSTAYSSDRHSQNWVVVSMTAEGRYGVDFDASHLGNGCSPGATAGVRPIGPQPNDTGDGDFF